ncbi:MAG: universal stress protein [Cyclobacteriaceae bacterium]|nr:universal stress protein [Cyclobacteriaceae bacterium]
MKDIDHSFHSIEDNKVVHGILEFIKDKNLDMLAMYPRKHELFERIFKGSLTKKIATDIHIPLLTIHE